MSSAAALHEQCVPLEFGSLSFSILISRDDQYQPCKQAYFTKTNFGTPCKRAPHHMCNSSHLAFHFLCPFLCTYYIHCPLPRPTSLHRAWEMETIALGRKMLACQCYLLLLPPLWDRTVDIEGAFLRRAATKGHFLAIIPGRIEAVFLVSLTA